MAEKTNSSARTAEVLKAFAQNVTISSTKARVELFSEVEECICGASDLPDAAVKGILKLLLLTVGKYRDGKSGYAVKKLIHTMAGKYLQPTAKIIGPTVMSFAESFKKLAVPSRSSSGDALFALTWTCIVMKEAIKKKDSSLKDAIDKIVNVQNYLIYGALASRNPVIQKATYRKMKVVWSLDLKANEDFAARLSDMEPSVHSMCSIGLLMRYFTEKKLKDSIAKFKPKFLELYVKQVLQSRSKPEIHVLESCKELLRHCTHAEFKEFLQPAAQKSMLRNPEIILQAVGYMIHDVQLDLSQYSIDLGKPLAAQLLSKNSTARTESAEAVKNLSRQCSDPEAVENFVAHLFGVFNGSEGKLTSVEQKVCVLQAVGNMSYHTVSGSGSIQNLSASVSEMFLPVLQQEVHEGTLIHALNMLSLWCVKFYTLVPDKLIEWYKTGIGLKTSSSAVRNAYIQCMNSSFHGDTLTRSTDVMSVLTQSLEKAKNQPTQSQLVTEALSAACILVKLSLVDIQAESKLGGFWNTVLDSSKQLFTNDKFLSAASDEALQSVVTLSERIILDHPHRLTDSISRQYYKSLVFCITRRPWSVRKHASSSVKRLLSMLGGSKIALCLIDEFKLLLQDQKLVDPITLAADSEKENQPLEGAKNIEPCILSQSLISISSVEMAETRDSEEIAIATLVPAHHCCIVVANSDTWTDLLFKIRVDPKNFIDNNLQKCLQFIKMDVPLDDNMKSVISTLVRISPCTVLPSILGHVKVMLTKPDLTQITQDDFGIYETPEGVPYDQTIIENAKRQVVEEKNIKKQNKMYSYDLQVDVIKTKKEKEKKKGEVKLTKAQEEQMEIQLQKESATRKRLSELHLLLQCGSDILEASLQGDPCSTCEHMVEICDIIVPLLQSPLAAPVTSKTLIKIGKAAFSDKNIGAIISNVTVRVLKPDCQLDINWTQENLDKQAGRALKILADASLPQEDTDTDSEKFPASTFAFIFYFLNVVLLKGSLIVGNNQSLLYSALQLIIEHAQMRRQHASGDGNHEEYDPEKLPRKRMMQLLLQVIGTSVGKMQQLATVALIEVTKASTGQGGSAKLGNSEIFVLLDSLQSPCTAVREASLRSLTLLAPVLPNVDDDNEVGLKIAHRVTVCCYDPQEDVKKVAVSLREDLDIEEPFAELCMLYIDDVVHSEEIVRKATALALADAVNHHPDYLPAILQSLLDKYEDTLFVPPPKLDEFGRLLGEQVPDQWEARSGVALALGKLAPYFPQDQILSVFEFYVPKALGDRHPEVRTNMRDSALMTITEHGKANVTVLLPLFEKFMLTAPDSANYDTVRQSIVILMGSLAKHLDKDNPKVKPIVAQLIAALSTPSQEVQDAVANCLPPLVPAIKDGAPELVQKLLHLLLESDTYGERKGAAYGLAGLVKGLGIVSLKQLEINTTLQDAIQDKKNPRRREGSLFAYEMFCLMLGRLFEPYIVHILPSLLLCFGDSSQYVREAADDTAKAVMSKLSAPGVKQVLPSLLRALEEDSWRTKTGSVELLGAMAFCAPKQLSQCLPSIVPKLIEVLTDSHIKVQKAGGQALKQIGSVIRNPEIQAIVPVLLDALQDPTKKTTACLHNLLETKFVHFIDAPSLALIMPVVERAFQDRATETRKMASQIIGNMYALTDQKDLSPYLPSVLPGLQQCLLDPVPEVRTVSARALGAMVKGMGESIFDDLLPWLMKTLVSEVSSVDRSGAAQGLSEVIGGMGLEKLEKLMPDIIQTAEKTELPPHVRDGYTMMYIFLPSVFGKEFVAYISAIIPSILKGLADESEYVRETALRAGQRIINLYADSAIELLLPELEKGLFDENWRIRYSSVQLLGDLLYNISGVSGKMTTETAHEDDNFGTETSQQAIFRTLGRDRRNRVLAGLYMGRSDTALLVRQSALHVWKVIVSNTPRTLREILPTLFKLLLGCLASTSHDKRQVAGRTLGDLVKKLGERVLPEIIPILENGLDSPHSDQRQGVCIGLSEIMEATSRDHVTVFADSLIPTVRRALCDPLPEVRLCASRTFDNLHANIGPRALDEILPDLLDKLGDEETSEQALDGLRQVMSFKSRVVLPYLVPQLTAKPVNTKALSFLSSVAGDSLIHHLSKILPALLTALSEKSGTPDEEQELEYCKKVVLSVETEAGVHTLVDDLLHAAKNSPPDRCYAAVTILHAFCRQTKSDYSDHLPQLFQGLISLFSSSDDRILHASWDCLDAVTKKLDPSEILQHIAHVRQAIRFVKSDFKDKELPGFSLPKKGIAPILPIFREGILNGSQEMKESAANGLGEVINLTSAEALKPSVVNITGPLIRILGDRFVWNVKVAVLQTLTLLLGKVGAMLKPFLPQLQTTFIKALNDPNRTVRLRAADALGKLIVIHVRVDPLFTELHNFIKTTEDTSMRDTTLHALRGCLVGAGTKMSDAIKKQIISTLSGLIISSEDTTRMTAAGCLGALCTCLPDEQLADLLINNILDTDVPEWVLRHGRGVSLGVALKEAPEKLLSAEFKQSVMKTIEKLVTADRIPICLSGYRCICYLLQFQLSNTDSLDLEMISQVTK